MERFSELTIYDRYNTITNIIIRAFPFETDQQLTFNCTGQKGLLTKYKQIFIRLRRHFQLQPTGFIMFDLQEKLLNTLI